MQQQQELITKDYFISQGIKALQNYGFVSVDKNNILDEMTYSLMFKSFLNDIRLLYPTKKSQKIIDFLINTIDNNIFYTGIK